MSATVGAAASSKSGTSARAGTSPARALRSFRARAPDEAAALTWSTDALPPSRFLVQHRTDSTASWGTIGTVPAADSVQTDGESGPAYRFETDRLEVGTHQFRLASASPEGAKSTPWTSTVVTAAIQLDGAFELSAYPNPVRDRATIELAVREAQDVTVAVYDVLGRRVATLHDGPMAAHEQHQLSLDTGRLGLPSGTYFVRARGEHVRGSRRLTVVR